MSRTVTVAWVTEQVAAIARSGDEGCDNEGAHMAEDQLHRVVLRAIAEGRCDDPKLCAAAALESQRLKFTRWFA